MRESPRDYFLSSKARYQSSQDVEDAADVFFAIRNMLNHGLEVDWDDVILKKVLDEVKQTKETVGAAVQEEGEEPKEKRRLKRFKVGTLPVTEQRPKMKEKEPDDPNEVDQFLIDQGLMTQHEAYKTTSGTEEGDPGESEQYQYTKWGLVGPKQRGPGGKGTAGEEWEIPSKHHNVPNMAPIALEDINPQILFDHDSEWLAEHAGEAVPGQDKYDSPITYGHYLQFLVSRPIYGNRRELPGDDSEVEGPLHWLNLFSESPISRTSMSNSAYTLSHEQLDPDSDDYLENECDKRHAANQAGLDACAQFPTEEQARKRYHKTHLHDRRCKTLGKIVPGKNERALPDSHVPWKIHEDSYGEWLHDMEEKGVLAEGMERKELRKLYNTWFDLVHMDGLQGTEGEDFILHHILDDTGKPKPYSRTKIINSPTYRRLRRESHNRVGFLPLMLGLKWASPDDRRIAVANMLAYWKEDPEHVIEKGDAAIEAKRGANAANQRHDDMIDYMKSAMARNTITWGLAWKGGPMQAEGVNPMPAVFREAADERAYDIQRALQGLHRMPMEPTEGEETGWDDPTKEPSKEKSALDYLVAAKVQFGENKLPLDWDLDKPAVSEFSEKFAKFLPEEYRDSGLRRFGVYWRNPPHEQYKSDAIFNLLHSTHERDAVEAILLSEAGHHENQHSQKRTPMYQYYRCLPKIGRLLRDADIYHVLAQAIPCLGTEKKYSDHVLEFGHNTKPPKPYSMSNPKYVDWLADLGKHTDIGFEVHNFLANDIVGPKFQKMWDNFYGPLEGLTGGKVNVDPFSSQRVMYLLNAIAAEKLDDASALERGLGSKRTSMNFTTESSADPSKPFAGMRSSGHQARVKDPGSRPLAFRVPNLRIAESLASILQPTPVYLPTASRIGLRGKLQELGRELYESLSAKGKLREDSQRRIFNLNKELEALGVKGHEEDISQLVARNSILRGSASTFLPHHADASTWPEQTRQNIIVRMKHPGEQAAISSSDDGFLNRLRRGASVIGGIQGGEGQAGVTRKGIRAGRMLTWAAKLFGYGGPAATYTGDDGEGHLVLDRVMDWSKKHDSAEKFSEWAESQPHPWKAGETITDYMGVGGKTTWRMHPKLEQDRYLYPVSEHKDDKGKDVHRMEMKDGVPVLEGHERISDAHKTQKKRTMSIHDLRFTLPGEEIAADEINNLFSMGTIPDKFLHTDETGKTSMVGEHPSNFLDSWADELRERDAPTDRVNKLKEEAHRRFLEKGEAHSMTEPEREEYGLSPELEEKAHQTWLNRNHEARTHGLYLESVIAMMPVVKRLFALSAVGYGGEAALQEYEHRYIKQHPSDTPFENQQKHLDLCYLFDTASKLADMGHIQRRPHILQQLKDEGFEFTKQEEERYNSPYLGADARYNKNTWSYPHENEQNDDFLKASNIGEGRDVEGFHLLGVYADRMYGAGSDEAEYIKEGLRKHYDMYGHRDRSGSPHRDREVKHEGNWMSVTDPIFYDDDGHMKLKYAKLLGGEKAATDVGKGGFHAGAVNRNRQDVILAQHHQKKLVIHPDDDPFPKHLRDLPEIAEAGESGSSARRDIMRRGMRARNTIRLTEYLENVGKDDPETRRFLTELRPVMVQLAEDLKHDDRLPEHTPHQSIQSSNDVMQEFARMLYMKGVFQHQKKSIPKPEKALGGALSYIGDNTPLNRDHEDYGGVQSDRLNLITPSGAGHHDRLHTIRGTPSHMMEVGRGFSNSRGHDAMPGILHSAEHMDEMQMPLLDYPITSIDPRLLNRAWGSDVQTERDNSNLGGHEEQAGSDEMVLGVISLDVLTDVDLLLKEEDRDKGKPAPVKAMHRIFSIDDLEFLRGFSDDWVVSSWPSGTRLIVEKKGKKVKARNSDGKAVSLPNVVKRGVKESHKKDFTVDAIWDKERLHIIDVLECGDNDLCDKPAKDRSRHLRAHFDSTEKVVTPAPVNTKRVDGEGLSRAVKDLMKEPDVKQVLLRDAESSYMRGESRHPKWVMLNPDHLVDVLVVSSSSVDNHLIGVGPLYDEDAKAIGNRAVRYEGDYYMDVGSVHREGLEEGMYITVKTSGVSHSMRRKYSVYRLNAPRYVRDSESGATDSIETLDILRNRQEGNIPHRVRIKKGMVHIEVPTGHVVYETEPYGNAFILKDVDSPDDYTLRVVESQRDYWSPIAAVLLRSEKESKGKERIEEEPPANHDKKPKKVLPKRDELLKDPEVVKTVMVALNMVEDMMKEKITWTGPKALGIDYGTPVESPHGPTKVTEPYDLPDHDPAARQKEPKACWCGAEEGDECAQGMGHNMENCPQAHPPKKEKEIEHIKISQDSRRNSSV